jgi:gliding motility-associated-like protein
VFTPNNDGINDYWHIEKIEHYTDNIIEIYNRHGKLVYKEKGYNNSTVRWNGKYKDKDLPSATYYYMIDRGNNSKMIKGYVTIIK